jgi:hypothetical protein
MNKQNVTQQEPANPTSDSARSPSVNALKNTINLTSNNAGQTIEQIVLKNVRANGQHITDLTQTSIPTNEYMRDIHCQ